MFLLKNRFNPLIFLEIAKKIKQSQNLDEKGKLRTSIGRAYYAAFLTVRSRLERKGGIFVKDKQHYEVREYLKTLGHDIIADFLEKLFEKRVDADYILTAKINEIIYDKCLMISEEIIESIEDI